MTLLELDQYLQQFDHPGTLIVTLEDYISIRGFLCVSRDDVGEYAWRFNTKVRPKLSQNQCIVDVTLIGKGNYIKEPNTLDK